jgi:hypothetical protein
MLNFQLDKIWVWFVGVANYPLLEKILYGVISFWTNSSVRYSEVVCFQIMGTILTFFGRLSSSGLRGFTAKVIMNFDP